MYSGALIEKMGALEMRLTRGYYRLFDNTLSYFQSVRGVCGLKMLWGRQEQRKSMPRVIEHNVVLERLALTNKRFAPDYFSLKQHGGRFQRG